MSSAYALWGWDGGEEKGCTSSLLVSAGCTLPYHAAPQGDASPSLWEPRTHQCSVL